MYSWWSTTSSRDCEPAQVTADEGLPGVGQRGGRRGHVSPNVLGEVDDAHELFTDFGVEAFAERSRIELEATGEHARKRTSATLDQLTAQEAQISRLAADGNTNREIAAHLFISPSTVEYHLRKAFRKLDVRLRTQLAKRLR
jgi:DNA-binding CsgD family transcriptional regulator